MIKKVLIIEDDVFLVKVMQQRFEKSGFETSILTDGSKAVETAKTFRPFAILVDLIMPEVDGFTSIENLKANEETKDIPIIVTSNLSTDDDIVKAKRLGVNHYFIKSNTDLSKIVDYIEKL